MKVKAEIWELFLQVKGRQRLPARHQKWGRKHKSGSFPQLSEGTNPAYNTLILDFDLPTRTQWTSVVPTTQSVVQLTLEQRGGGATTLSAENSCTVISASKIQELINDSPKGQRHILCSLSKRKLFPTLKHLQKWKCRDFIYWEKSTYKWTQAVQTHIVQGSAVSWLT